MKLNHLYGAVLTLASASLFVQRTPVLYAESDGEGPGCTSSTSQQAQDPRQAGREHSERILLAKRHLKPIFEEAQWLYDQGRYSDSLALAQHVFQEDRLISEELTNTDYVLLVAENLLELGRLDEAQHYLEIIAQKRTKSKDITAANMILEIKRGRLANARQIFEAEPSLRREGSYIFDLRNEWNQLKNGTANSLLALALVLRAADFDSNEIRHVKVMERANALAPNNHAISCLLGIDYRSQRNWRLAKPELTFAAQSSGQAGDLARSYLNRGPIGPDAPSGLPPA